MHLAPSISGLFKWRQFEPEVILLAVGWYLRFSLSYRDVEELLAEVLNFVGGRLRCRLLLNKGGLRRFLQKAEALGFVGGRLLLDQHSSGRV
jgi:hypothetical protein